MQLSSRRFLIAQDGVLYRLADVTFTRMLQNPHEHPRYSGGATRAYGQPDCQVVGGRSVRVVRSTFATLTFDEDGHMDLGMFTRAVRDGRDELRFDLA